MLMVSSCLILGRQRVSLVAKVPIFIVTIDETFPSLNSGQACLVVLENPMHNYRIDRTFMSCLAGLENPAYCIICIDVWAGVRREPFVTRLRTGSAERSCTCPFWTTARVDPTIGKRFASLSAYYS